MVKKNIKKRLSKLRHNFFREKYRFDQGNSFLVFLNFSLLVISLVKQYDGNQNYTIWYVVGGLFGTWFLGYFLDRVVKVQDALERVSLARSPIWKENFDHHYNLDQKIDLIDHKMASLDKKLSHLEILIRQNTANVYSKTPLPETIHSLR